MKISDAAQDETETAFYALYDSANITVCFVEMNILL